MFGISLAVIFRIAAQSILIQGARSVMTSLLKRIYVAVQSVLARFPLSASALATVVANFAARYGFNVSSTELLIVSSAVAVFIAALAHKSGKAVAAKAK